jgi:hypothetical protein
VIVALYELLFPRTDGLLCVYDFCFILCHNFLSYGGFDRFHFGLELLLHLCFYRLFLLFEFGLDVHVLLFVVLDLFLEVGVFCLQGLVIRFPLNYDGIVSPLLLELLVEGVDQCLRFLVLTFPLLGETQRLLLKFADGDIELVYLLF